MRDHLDPAERLQADGDDRLLAELFCQHLDHPNAAWVRARAHSPALGRRLAVVVTVYHDHTRQRSRFDGDPS